MNNTISFDKAELVRLMKLCFSFPVGTITKVRYMLGAKPKMGAIPGVGFMRADCSGFVRWLIDGATHGEVTIPDGSMNQLAWCIENDFGRVQYTDASENDNVLRIAFIRAKKGKVGHVWLVINGLTIESYGGHGAGRRRWNTPVLIKNVDACFELTGVLK